MERTLIIFKPDAVMRGIVGEVLSRFEKAGFKIVAAKMLQPDHEHYHEHYEGIGTLKTRKGEEIFSSQLASMQEGPVIAMVLEGVDAVETVRKMIGPTEPKTAQPGTVRGDYAHVSYDRPTPVVVASQIFCMLQLRVMKPPARLPIGSLMVRCMTTKRFIKDLRNLGRNNR